jgi:hypothetical protein
MNDLSRLLSRNTYAHRFRHTELPKGFSEPIDIMISTRYKHVSLGIASYRFHQKGSYKHLNGVSARLASQ